MSCSSLGVRSVTSTPSISAYGYVIRGDCWSTWTVSRKSEARLPSGAGPGREPSQATTGDPPEVQGRTLSPSRITGIIELPELRVGNPGMRGPLSGFDRAPIFAFRPEVTPSLLSTAELASVMVVFIFGARRMSTVRTLRRERLTQQRGGWSAQNGPNRIMADVIVVDVTQQIARMTFAPVDREARIRRDRTSGRQLPVLRLCPIPSAWSVSLFP